jgi:hypothetical protein
MNQEKCMFPLTGANISAYDCRMEGNRNSKKQTAALLASLAIAEAIRTVGSVPSGHLYAQVMSRISLDSYQAIIRMLKGAGLVRESCNELTWIGPRLSQ